MGAGKPTKLARLKGRAKDAWHKYLIAGANARRMNRAAAEAHDRWFAAEGKVNHERVCILAANARKHTSATPKEGT